MENYGRRRMVRLGEREKNQAPFPRAMTTEEILAVQEAIHAAGLLVVAPENRPVHLRAPEPWEKGVIIAETIDEGEKDVYHFSAARAAPGKPGGALWFCNHQYEFSMSRKEMRANDDAREARATAFAKAQRRNRR